MGSRRFVIWLASAGFAAFAGISAWLVTTDFAGASQLATIGSLVVAISAGVAQVWWFVGNRYRNRDQQMSSPDDLSDRLAQMVKNGLQRAGSLQRLDEALSALWTSEPTVSDATIGSDPTHEHDIGESRTDMSDIGDFFSHLAVPRMVILGQPGSGKTQLSLYLISRILERRRHGDPVPVPLHAADWDPGNESLDTWMIRSLAENYLLPTRSAAHLVADGLVIPVIDGLDELPADIRTVAVMQLNRGGRALRPVVLTCRTSEYRQIDPRGVLQDTTTVVLMPLSSEIVARYFEDLSHQDHRWQPIAAYLQEHPDGGLAIALSTPLMAALMRTVYAESNDPAELLDEGQFPGSIEIEAHLLDRSIDAVAAISTRTTNHPAFGNIQRRWLASLAVVMSSDISQGFAWWRLGQMTPVPRRAISWIRWLGPLTIAATIGLLALEWQRAIAGAFAAALVGAEVWPLKAKMPRQFARRGWQPVVAACLAAAAGFIIGSALALVPLRHGAILTAVRTSQAKQYILGLFGAVALVSLSISRPGITPHSSSYLPGLQTDRRIAVARSTSVALFIGIGCATWLSRGPVTLSIIALVAFLTVLLGGSAWGQYTCSHAWLALTERFPWRLGLFLNDAEMAGILRRAEGVVQFRYPVLQERLATEGRIGTQNDGAPPVLRAQTGIVEEVLALPEAITYISSGTAHERRDEVQRMAREAIASNVARISAAGADQYQRFQQARKLMADAVGHPAWSRPRRLYGFLAAIALGVALAAYGMIYLPTGALVWIAVAALAMFAAGAVLHRQWRLRSRRQASLGFAVQVGAWILVWTLVVVAISVLAPGVARQPPVPLIALGATFAAPLSILAWAAAGPYAAAQVRLSSDDPLQWPETVQAVRRYYDATMQARRDWLTVLAREGVAPIIRGRLRQGQLDDPFTLRDLDPARLGGVRRSDELVETAANQQISWLLNKLESGSLGISGTRGSGKSTLLQRHCTYGLGSASNDLLVLVSAPTNYDRREFLVYMFSEVCQQVTGPRVTDAVTSARIWARLSRLLPGSAVIAGLGLIVGTLTWSNLTATATDWAHHRSVLLLVAGGLLTAAGTASALWRSRRTGQPKRRASEAEIAATGYLQALRFQSSATRSHDGKLSLPGGFEFGASGQVQRTEQTRAYPELVAQFRSLLDQVGLERRPLGGQVVIGIDELDKMASAEEAEKFLNDLKAVFGVRGCYFLVAVSEDAMATFDRRALGVRTAFDTAFDSIVSVEPLTVAEAGSLLDRRGVSVPEPFLWLCQALAGGLPRDLLRNVLALAMATSTESLNNFSDLAHQLIVSDLTTVLKSQLCLASAQSKDYLDVVSWLAGARKPSGSADELEKLIRSAPQLGDGEGPDRLIRQTRSYLYHAATLIRLFVDGSTPSTKWPPGGTDGASIDQLAAARAAIAGQPEVAWRAIDAFRHATPEMLLIDAEAPASPSAGNGQAEVMQAAGRQA